MKKFEDMTTKELIEMCELLSAQGNPRIEETKIYCNRKKPQYGDFYWYISGNSSVFF